jgi:acid phosphatase (class A)
MPHLPRKLLLALALTSLTTACLVNAQGNASLKQKVGERLHYLSTDSVDVVALLPPPPSPDSAEQKRDLDEVMRLQQTRTPADIERAKSTSKFVVFSFADLLAPNNPKFSADSCPKTAAFFSKLEKDSKYFTNFGKEYWGRPRPYIKSDKVDPKEEKEKEGSYPSGHSTRATLFALILSDLFPEKRDALLDRSCEDGHDRIILGVHYPTDIFAGRVLGQALYLKAREDPKFQKDLNEVRDELKSAGVLR